MRIEIAAPRRRSVSLTPLIDVVFLLLLFFMLASTFARFATVDVTLAREGVGGAATSPARNVLLSVREGGFFSLDGREVSLSEIAPALRTLGRSEDIRIIVRPSAGAVAQDVVSGVDAARRAEAGSVLLVH